MPIAIQRVAKHIPRVTLSTIAGHQFLGNGAVNTVFPVGFVPRSYEGTEKMRRTTSTTENEIGACPSDL
jgi:hypothetical protein